MAQDDPPALGRIDVEDALTAEETAASVASPRSRPASSTTVAATFTDVGTLDTHTCTFSWDDGDAANKTYGIPICNDVTPEADETVNITLSSPTGGAALGSPSNQPSRISSSSAGLVVRRDSASTLASFHLRAPRAVSASVHSAARTPGTAARR